MKPLVTAALSLAAIGVGAWALSRRGHGNFRGARRRGGLRGDSEAHELQLFCENDGDLHRRQGSYIERALEKRLKKGTYNHTLAAKAWGHLVESCAKKYNKEFGDESSLPWHKMFSTADRRAVAQKFADHFKNEWEIQNRGG